MPGYPPHPELLARLGEAAADRAGAGYGLIAGDEALRAALAEDANGFYGAPIEPGHVAITAGCSLACAMAMKVLVPTPRYVNHDMALTLAGVEARPLPCRTGGGFVPDVAPPARLADDRRIMQARPTVCRAALKADWIDAMGSCFAYLRLLAGASDAMAAAGNLAA